MKIEIDWGTEQITRHTGILFPTVISIDDEKWLVVPGQNAMQNLKGEIVKDCIHCADMAWDYEDIPSAYHADVAAAETLLAIFKWKAEKIEKEWDMARPEPR